MCHYEEHLYLGQFMILKKGIKCGGIQQTLFGKIKKTVILKDF